MTTIQVNAARETDRARWERYARLIDGAARLESIARTSRIGEVDAREMLQEAAELRAMARAIA